MKRITRTLVIVTFATAATAAMAANSPFPSSAPEETPLSSDFPNIRSYADIHSADRANQPELAGPAAGQQEYPLSSDFPNSVTYKQEHRSDPVAASRTPTFPYSVPNEESLADEGLVPGIAGVPPAVGATR